MAAVDMTQRKLIFPPRFLPYLEKHRIFELFHECIELLVQNRPQDHILYLKSILPTAALRKDKQRIVFIAPPSFDRETFANLVADCMDIRSISRMYMETLARDRMKKEEVRIQEIKESISEESEESCICPPEDAEWQYYPPFLEENGELYYPEERILEDLEKLGEAIQEEEWESKMGEECVCICPCLKEQEENKPKEEAVQVEEELEEEEEFEEWDEWGEEPPCISFERPKIRKRYKPESDFFSPTESVSEIDVDFGLLAESELATKGWILQDFPMTGEEAENLNRLGVLPTHAVRIIVDEEKENDDRDYKWTLIKWMNAYHFVPVIEIYLGDRTLEKLSMDMCKLLSGMPNRFPPMVPRVVLIGCRGSGMTTQGQKLAQKLNLVHVEFEVVKSQALEQDEGIYRLYKQQLKTRPDPEVEAVILEKVLMSSACRCRGWVLTGYPRNVDQMRMLDMIATPPNRVIFIEVPARECFVRLYYRKFDPSLGKEYKIPDIEPVGVDSYKTNNIEPEIANRLLTHPKNEKKQIIGDIESYFLEKKEMKAYCGKTASRIDGDKPVNAVNELIGQVIVNPLPPHPPRNPFSVNHGIDESYEKLKKYRIASGLYFNNLLLNPPEGIPRF